MPPRSARQPGQYVAKRATTTPRQNYSVLKKPYRMSQRSYAKRSGYINVVKTIPSPSTFVSSSTPNQPAYSFLTFDLATIPEFQTYCDLYDEYKCNKITVKFFPLFNSVDATSAAATAGYWDSDFITAVDFNFSQSTSTPSLADILGYGTHKRTSYSQVHSRTFIPKMNQQVQIQLDTIPISTTTVKTAFNRWMECDPAQITFPFYGLHCFANAWGSSGTASTGFVPTWRIEITYDLSFRSTV